MKRKNEAAREAARNVAARAVNAREKVADKEVIKAKRGETSYIIDIQAESAEKPWRCYHDGTKCTGTEYQGEG